MMAAWQVPELTSEVGVARALADHGGGHEAVDDGGLAGAGADLEHRRGLIDHRRVAKAVLNGHGLAGGTALNREIQFAHARGVGVILSGVGRQDDDLSVVAVGVGALHGGEDLVRQGHAIPDDVYGLAVKLHDLIVPLDDLEDGLDAQAVRKGAGKVGVKAYPLAGLVLVVHGLELGYADYEAALLPDVGHIALGGGLLAGRGLGSRSLGGGRLAGLGRRLAAGGQGEYHAKCKQKRKKLFHLFISPSFFTSLDKALSYYHINEIKQ